MTINELETIEGFRRVTPAADAGPVTGVFCCDMLSLAMSRGVEGAAWITVMGNINTLAVCKLTGMSCIVLAEGVQPDEKMLEKATEERIPVFVTELPVYEAARAIDITLTGTA